MERVAVKYEMEWFQNMVITASNDINEETILSLNEQGHKITCFGTKKNKTSCFESANNWCIDV